MSNTCQTKTLDKQTLDIGPIYVRESDQTDDKIYARKRHQIQDHYTLEKYIRQTTNTCQREIRDLGSLYTRGRHQTQNHCTLDKDIRHRSNIHERKILDIGSIYTRERHQVCLLTDIVSCFNLLSFVYTSPQSVHGRKRLAR